MDTIVNAAGRVIDRGAQDLSSAPYTRTLEERPQHIPKWLIFAKKGPTTEELVVGAGRTDLYGAETFREGSPYFNHATLFANGSNQAGNAGMYVRLIPKDAGPKPTIRLSLDLLPTTVDLYERLPDGSIKTDVAGDPIITGTTQGYRGKLVRSYLATPAEVENFGAATQAIGDQTDPVTNVTSIRYPIMDLEHSFFGEGGNNAGIRLWAQTTKNTPQLPSKLMARTKAYPYTFSVIVRNEDTGTAHLQDTIFGEKQITIVFKPGVRDPDSRKRLYAGDTIINEYQNLTDSRYTKKYGEFGRAHVYQDNIDAIVALLHEKEIPFIDHDSDFTDDPEDASLFNFLTAQSSRGVQYHSYILSDQADSLRLGATTNVYAQGGSDGTMTQETHAQLVGEYLDRYLDEMDELNDLLYHIESHIYDSGFPLETKYKLIPFIARRKDTLVALSPAEAGQPKQDLSEEYSVASSLLSVFHTFPESSYFGTSVYRGIIVGGTGVLRGSEFTDRIPATYELMRKGSRYMGAANGIWKEGFGFDRFPGNVIDELEDISYRWVPDSVRNRFWDVGLNWIGRYDRDYLQFPHLKTVYNEDTSVMTGYLTACAMAYVNKIAHLAHRTFCGAQDLTPAQLSERVNDFVAGKVKGIFDNRFRIVPRAHFTSMDQVRNFSWTLPIDFYAPGMYTVQTTFTVSRRLSDYTGE